MGLHQSRTGPPSQRALQMKIKTWSFQIQINLCGKKKMLQDADVSMHEARSQSATTTIVSRSEAGRGTLASCESKQQT
jgi:hypothetical protein